MHEYKIVEAGKPLEQAGKAIILLHGRGGSARDILSLADAFCDETFYIAAPQATNNAWYPYSFMAPEVQNEPWLFSSVQTVKRLLDTISEQIPVENIYVMGFSQGACLTLEVTTRYAAKYGGVAAFTGGLIGEKIRTEKYQGNFAGTKVFIGNSTIDPHVPVIRSEESKNLMEKAGADVTLKIYPDMPHTIIQDEIELVLKLMF
jgi:phospholipase/carboxylesterase